MARYVSKEKLDYELKNWNVMTGVTVRAVLENVPFEDVIPTAFVKEWYQKHYHTDACPIVEDWKNRSNV